MLLVVAAEALDPTPASAEAMQRFDVSLVGGTLVSDTGALAGGGGIAFAGGVRFDGTWALYLRPVFLGSAGTRDTQFRVFIPALLEFRIAWGFHVGFGAGLDVVPSFEAPGIDARFGGHLRIGSCVFATPDGCYENEIPGPQSVQGGVVSVDLDVHATAFDGHVEVTLLVGPTISLWR